MRPAFLLTLLLTLTCFAQDDKSHPAPVRIGDYNAPGMRTLRQDRSGAPFAIELTPQGPVTPTPSFELKGAKGSPAARLVLKDLKFDGRRLTALMTVQNMSGAKLEKVRLTITGVTEQYRTKDKAGNETTATRTMGADMANAIMFGDVADGSSSDDVDLTVEGFRTSPDTRKFTVHGVVNGIH